EFAGALDFARELELQLAIERLNLVFELSNQPILHRRHGSVEKIPQCYASAVERITSRQNGIVAQYRAAARGDSSNHLLLDGVHLVSDALEARVRLQHVMVAAEAQEHPDIQPLLARAAAQQAAVAVASAKVMEAASPVRST